MATKKKTAEKPAETVEELKEEKPKEEELKEEELPFPEVLSEASEADGKVKIAPAQTGAPEKVKVVKNNDGTPRFTKKQLLASKRYTDNRDALHAVLDDKATYTLAEVDKALSAFSKR